jgi:uncharacterized protein (DUF1800 family)
MRFRRLRVLAMVAVSSAAVLGCSGDSADRSSGSDAPASASSGQVEPPKTYKATYYAASRFAEQASFGPTPALIEELRTKGFAQWIDEQLALPPSKVDPDKFTQWHLLQPGWFDIWNPWMAELHRLWLAAPDQLRQRVTWSLSQYIVVSSMRLDPGAVGIWFNQLHDMALGNYGNLIYGISTNAAVGFYLDNAQNRPKSAECPHCAPNENYARELMQLFTLGVVKLNPDGSTVRQAGGRPVETYTQRDVDELARVLTGWTYAPKPPGAPMDRNFGNFEQPMVPSTWAPERDSGAKTVLGRVFPAGQSQQKDLQDLVSLLMGHQNIAPFVALRMIQHLVKSNPSPAYIGRVGAVFRDNGQGVAGDMKAVVKAVLLDPEARAGDDPATLAKGDGKVREPVLHLVGMLRGLGCQRAPVEPWSGKPMFAPHQSPFNPISVFSFYAPTDLSPGRNVLAPEQKLLTASEFRHRLWHLQYMLSYDSQNVGLAQAREMGLQRLRDAGCGFDAMLAAYRSSPRSFFDLLGQRYFRGALPPSLRVELEKLAQTWKTTYGWSDEEIVVKLLTMALVHPAYGAIL